ncbi:MAG: hypothetical protein JNJ45_02295 [Chthonomonas sp.]|nr:hypothetical protein [Chthonomonas sp.]
MVIAASALIAHLIVQPDLPRRGSLGLGFTPLAPEIAKEHKLGEGEGLLAAKPVPGGTGELAGVREGDIVISINGRTAKAQGLSAWVRTLPSGGKTRFSVIRDGKKVELTAKLVERPRDPGGDNYTVSYSSVNTAAGRMRTIITTPKKPGKHPAFMFIQGLSPLSYDFNLATSKGDVATIDGPLLHEIANSNYVTMRVEKPGVGDSEGGPYETLDFMTEADIYRQAMKQLVANPGIDKGNLFIFGHSMGGSFGPMMACEFPVKGIATYGTAGRTWFEYLIDVIRYQGLVAGDSFENADDSVRQVSHIMALAILEKKELAEIKKLHPELAPLVDAYFPGGLFNGKALPFWRQLNDTNFAKFWAKCGSHVLAARGVSDFVTYDADHKLIADIANRAKPGSGKFVMVPSSDHLFHRFATEKESMQNFSKGTFTLEFTTMLKAWMAEVMAR